MVFVSGMFIATKHATRRNGVILMLSMALGIGVAMEPHLFEGGGVASFYGKNLRHNTGFWPRYKTCKTFPVDSETGAQVRTCTNDNGACCSVQKPKFHGVRRPTHRLISTQVPRTVNGTGHTCPMRLIWNGCFEAQAPSTSRSTLLGTWSSLGSSSQNRNDRLDFLWSGDLAIWR